MADPKAENNVQHFLAKIAGAEETAPVPQTNVEHYLAKIAGEDVTIPAEPSTTEEYYLDKIAEGGVGVEVVPLNVTENDTYTAPSGKAYSPVTVNVPSPPVKMWKVTVTGLVYGITVTTNDSWLAEHYNDTSLRLFAVVKRGKSLSGTMQLGLCYGANTYDYTALRTNQPQYGLLVASSSFSGGFNGNAVNNIYGAPLRISSNGTLELIGSDSIDGSSYRLIPGEWTVFAWADK